MKKHNVLIIMLDALRADHLGFLGYKRNTSPNIDKFAKKALVFKKNTSQASFSGPAHFAFLTSTFALGTNLDVLNPRLETIASVLKPEGYFTGGIINSPVTSKKRGFAKGFDEFFETRIEKDVVGEKVKNSNAEAVAKKTIEWIKKNKAKKWFLFVQMVDTHGPYESRKPFNEMFVNDAYYDESKKVPLLQHYVGFGGIPDYQQVNKINKVDWYIAQYDGAIAFMDYCFGKIVAELKKSGLDKKTVIALISDHGESLGEHGLFFCHGASLYEETIHVPMIMALPGKKAMQIESVSRSIDLMPTILDFLEIAIPKQVNGKSFLPLIGGKSMEEPVAFSAVNADIGTKAVKQYISCIRKENWKLIRTESSLVKKKERAKSVLQQMKSKGIARKIPGLIKKIKVLIPVLTKSVAKPKLELYNLETDPKELKNLVHSEKAKAKELEKELIQWNHENKTKATEQEKLQEKIELDYEIEKELRRLGYKK